MGRAAAGRCDGETQSLAEIKKGGFPRHFRPLFLAADNYHSESGVAIGLCLGRRLVRRFSSLEQIDTVQRLQPAPRQLSAGFLFFSFPRGPMSVCPPHPQQSFPPLRYSFGPGCRS
ncbi:hypothetical protein [Ralstonia solanacearum]|uniref:Uncharacterized protein n=1 Tax=Ralstonia solanacearum TaxID=305 RepID=A0AAE3NPW9_RALSL|nr:hypothetical protein [Ralstonia solanacearum]MDB0524854.1 hypothetical protein [Ralstonia solanacearum]